MTHLGDQVFHTLELAQHIVHHLEERDLFSALRITRALWDSKEPISAWGRHFRHFGYADRLIDQYTDRYHPRDVYFRICRTVDAIGRRVAPTCTVTDLREKDAYDALVRMGKQDIQYMSRQRELDEVDIYTLDSEGMHLLYTKDVIYPESCFDNSSHILGEEDQQIVARNTKDWSLSGSFGHYKSRSEWWTQGRHVLSVHGVQEGETHNMVFEVWDAHGVKRGELVHPEDGYRLHDAENLGENLMTTIGDRLIKVWDLESLKCVYEYEAPKDNPSCIIEVQQNVAYYTPRIGLYFIEFWTIDGTPMTDARAQAVKHAHDSWCKFSDGTMVSWSVELLLHSPEGKLLFFEDQISAQVDGFAADAGILFDRFFFAVFEKITDDGEPAKPAKLTLYSKEGDVLRSKNLRKGQRSLKWFVDITGRLVFVYLGRNDEVEELEVVDFCS